MPPLTPSPSGQFSSYILAGGQSRRFGSDKALARLQGEPLILRVARALAQVGPAPLVIADQAEKYQHLGLVTLLDHVPQQGPLAGLQRALEHGANQGCARVLVAACDLLELPAHWLRRLLATPATSSAAFFHGRWDPFPGLYATRLLPEVTERIHSQQLALQPLLSAHAVALPRPPDWPAVAQANTRDQLADYASRIRDVPHASGNAETET